MNPVRSLVDGVIGLFSIALFAWCLLSWFPNINMYEQPWRTLDRIVRPVIDPLRKVIPPVGNIDLSPIVLIFVIQMAQKLIHNLM